MLKDFLTVEALLGMMCVMGVFAGGLPQAAQADGEIRVYLGTYTRAPSTSKGIYLARLNLATGQLTAPEPVAEVTNPTFLAFHPNGKFLYAIGEIADFGGQKTGAVSALAIDPQTGRLTLLNQQPSQGVGPCHVSVDATGRNALVANYGGGSVSCLPIGADGRLAPPSCSIQHFGSSVNPKRQAGPHAHSINVAPDNRFAFVADLGMDQLFVYKFDAAKGKLAPNDPPSAVLKPGAGPRHFAFHPNKRFAYVINELDSTVTAFRYDMAQGTLETLQSLSTLPADWSGASTTAEVAVHPSGRFLYGSNRGHDSIAIFAVDENTGKLTFLGCESTQGKHPRNFGIDPSGRFLVAANMQSDNVVVFRIDPQSGKLQATGSTISLPMPSCVKFMK
jgi:6-phosphogluconolactonase